VTRPLVVLGATGSIGLQTIAVARHLHIPVTGLAAKRPSKELAQLAVEHRDAAIAVAGGTNDERKEFAAALAGRRVQFGSPALAELAATPAHTVVNAVVGLAGLPFTLAALEAGNRLALANKESLVVAGALVQEALARGRGELVPVDSEHSAIMQCLMGESRDAIARVILTASGGPFRGWSREEMESVTPDQALKHPNWAMGRRITIDSATMVNKALEVIEAHNLFGLEFDRIEVVIHPQSIIHSMVEFIDGSTKAQLGQPDMRIPIELALTYPERAPRLVEAFPWEKAPDLTFEAVDDKAFPALSLGYEAGRRGGTATVAFNAADEVAVDAFLRGRLGFNAISQVIAEVLEKMPATIPGSLTEVMEADREARSLAAGIAGAAC
jgi:1-deoxy-D-xylulose-5-phosphate reductoisomerase